jgi:hypothetical protein
MQSLTVRRVSQDNTRYFIENAQPERPDDPEELIISLMISKENYIAMARATKSLELKSVCNLYAADRANYAFKLYRYMSSYGGLSVIQTDSFSGEVNPLWNNMLSTEAAKSDAVMLSMIIKSEAALIEKYEAYLSNHIPVIKHLQLLSGQIKGIKEALRSLYQL